MKVKELAELVRKKYPAAKLIGTTKIRSKYALFLLENEDNYLIVSFRNYDINNPHKNILVKREDLEKLLKILAGRKLKLKDILTLVREKLPNFIEYYAKENNLYGQSQKISYRTRRRRESKIMAFIASAALILGKGNYSQEEGYVFGSSNENELNRETLEAQETQETLEIKETKETQDLNLEEESQHCTSTSEEDYLSSNPEIEEIKKVIEEFLSKAERFKTGKLTIEEIGILTEKLEEMALSKCSWYSYTLKSFGEFNSKFTVFLEELHKKLEDYLNLYEQSTDKIDASSLVDKISNVIKLLNYVYVNLPRDEVISEAYVWDYHNETWRTRRKYTLEELFELFIKIWDVSRLKVALKESANINFELDFSKNRCLKDKIEIDYAYYNVAGSEKIQYSIKDLEYSISEFVKRKISEELEKVINSDDIIIKALKKKVETIRNGRRRQARKKTCGDYVFLACY